jgi:formylmethanofuran dehydrogenase subunit E-like metal-binding protein
MTRFAYYLISRRYLIAVAFLCFASLCTFAFAGDNRTVYSSGTSYEKWESVGRLAADTCLDLMRISDRTALKNNLIALTNAGYAEVNGLPTQGAIDGLSVVTGATRGNNTLIEIHSAPWVPLWFAVYDKRGGHCAYLEVDPTKIEKMTKGQPKVDSRIFSKKAMERIDAEYLYKNAAEYKTKFENKMFGGNTFRIITIANAVSAGAPAYTVRAFEFHDHYCPGVTSGIIMAQYLKKHFPAENRGYFIHSVDPWCKEDALLVLLNATPGKRGYAVSYPNEADRKRKAPEAENASTIVYRQMSVTGKWEGMILGFQWADTTCPDTGNKLIDKLCADLWYLEHMENPEDFVKVIKKFELPDGVSPQDWARPGKDPLAMLGMVP